jgi:hypothetical protein
MEAIKLGGLLARDKAVVKAIVQARLISQEGPADQVSQAS